MGGFKRFDQPRCHHFRYTCTIVVRIYSTLACFLGNVIVVYLKAMGAIIATQQSQDREAAIATLKRIKLLSDEDMAIEDSTIKKIIANWRTMVHPDVS